MVSKMLGIRLKRGERVRLQTPGGGGWGKPGDRSAQARAKDLEEAYVSKEKS
jgi:N-methylhydantoinase B